MHVIHINPDNYIDLDDQGNEKAKHNQNAVKSGWIVMRPSGKLNKTSIYICPKPSFYYRDSFADLLTRTLFTEFPDESGFYTEVISGIIQFLTNRMPHYQLINLTHKDQCARCFNIKKFVKERDYHYQQCDEYITFNEPLCTWCSNHLLTLEKKKILKAFKIKQKEEEERKQQEHQRLLLEKARLYHTPVHDLNQITGFEFEELVGQRILPKVGYTNIEITRKTSDYGVDIIATSSSGKRTAFQCKRHKAKVGMKAIQEIYTAMTIFDCTEAIVVTNSTFSDQAKSVAPKLQVELWDKHKLLEIL
ncbi:restriction endonuclease [Niallia endozanthoxylica]|nr:restriction endonuclease [Niallia endozanthoxylica]